MSNVGRLAFRVEGEMWVAYYAMPHTMDGAIPLGSIQMSLVQDQERKRAFMEIFKSALTEILEEKIGPVGSWDEQRAPESERSGSA